MHASREAADAEQHAQPGEQESDRAASTRYQACSDQERQRHGEDRLDPAAPAQGGLRVEHPPQVLAGRGARAAQVEPRVRVPGEAAEDQLACGHSAGDAEHGGEAAEGRAHGALTRLEGEQRWDEQRADRTRLLGGERRPAEREEREGTAPARVGPSPRRGGQAREDQAQGQVVGAARGEGQHLGLERVQHEGEGREGGCERPHARDPAGQGEDELRADEAGEQVRQVVAARVEAVQRAVEGEGQVDEGTMEVSVGVAALHQLGGEETLEVPRALPARRGHQWPRIEAEQRQVEEPREAGERDEGDHAASDQRAPVAARGLSRRAGRSAGSLGRAAAHCSSSSPE